MTVFGISILDKLDCKFNNYNDKHFNFGERVLCFKSKIAQIVVLCYLCGCKFLRL
ncbi:hypothetical protein M949_0284 [Riemerella anatipestifer CH3]|nr:hypothetical protein M949_0284 [Riemerella anatipestifer CH3]